jgi:hypothetical protein
MQSRVTVATRAASVTKELIEGAFASVEEALGEEDSVGVLVGDRLDAGGMAVVDRRPGIGEYERGVRRDDELRVLVDELMDAPQQRQQFWGESAASGSSSR